MDALQIGAALGVLCDDNGHKIDMAGVETSTTVSAPSPLYLLAAKSVVGHVRPAWQHCMQAHCTAQSQLLIHLVMF